MNTIKKTLIMIMSVLPKISDFNVRYLLHRSLPYQVTPSYGLNIWVCETLQPVHELQLQVGRHYLQHMVGGPMLFFVKHLSYAAIASSSITATKLFGFKAENAEP